MLTAISWVPNCPLEHRPNHLPVDCKMDTSTLLASENTADIPRTIVATDVALLLDKGPYPLRDRRVVVGGRRSGRPWLGPGLV